MDALDRKILAELQEDGRLSITDLAGRVNLSISPCHRRVRALEASGAIKGYRAQLDPGLIGLGFSAIVFVTLKEGDRQTLEQLDEAIRRIPQITEAKRLFGDPDYIFNIVCTDLAAFQKLYDEQLSALPGVQRLISTIVMKNIVPERRFPV